MSNGKSGRKKIVRVIVIIGVLIVLSYLGIDLNEFTNLSNSQNKETQHTSNVSDQKDLEGELILTMIDVGQADSFLLVQNGKTALVDCGTRSTGENVVEHLKQLGITKIDYVFGTHPHDDHMGGMYDVITNFDIGTIIIPKVESGSVTANWYMKLMKEINSGGYNLEYASVGTLYHLGDATMKVIGPITKEQSNLNNYSTVLKVSFGEQDIIMTGDAEKEVEEEILLSKENIDAEILKVGHHGSDTSSSEEFLDAISPDYALISSKLGNKHEHPIKSTMEKLEDRNIKVYRTDESGTIVVTITSNNVSFNSEPGDYLSGTELEKKEGLE